MVYLAGIIAGLLLTLGFGWFSLALAAAGLISLVAFLARDRAFPSLSLGLAIAALYSTSAISSSGAAMIVWLGCLYLGRLLYTPPLKVGLPWFSIPLAFWILVSHFGGKTLQVQFLLPLLVATLPTPRSLPICSRFQNLFPLMLWATLVFLCGAAVLLAPNRHGAVAYIQNGKWAKTDEPFRLEGLDIASSYSYSEFLRLVGGHLCEPLALSKSEQIAWLITPTKPFADDELAAIEKWVGEGGHLVAVSDHTDLFGHARTMNSVLKKFGVNCTYTATITEKARDPITYGDGRRFSILTGNTVHGSSIWPIATTMEYLESAYYALPNFFGPLSPEKNTPYSRWVIMGCKSFGKGSVSLVTDSTVLSNFAVFQPGTAEFIDKAQSLPAIAVLLKWLPLGFFFSLVIALLSGWTRPLPVSLIGFSALVCLSGPKLQWTNKDLVWSGDPSLVLDNSSPGDSFTTAFSISALSGCRPRWVDSPAGHDHGIWVAKTPPPSQNWKWLSPQKNPNAEKISHDAGFDSLLRALGAEPVLGWQSIKESKYAKAGSIWTDDRMGTWWFDRGLSPARQARFQALLDWINSKPLQPNPKGFVPSNTNTTEFLFRMDGSDKETSIRVPKLPQSKDPILVGNGISAQMVKIQGVDTLISVSPWMEYWQSPKIWTAAEKRGERGK